VRLTQLDVPTEKMRCARQANDVERADRKGIIKAGLELLGVTIRNGANPDFTTICVYGAAEVRA
jgi:hypothetical protein